MTNSANKPANKKVNLCLPAELFKAAKLRAAQEEKTLTDWLFDLIQKELQTESQVVAEAFDWGRIDSRIDQRTAFLEHRLETLSNKVEHLLAKQQTQGKPAELLLSTNSEVYR